MSAAPGSPWLTCPDCGGKGRSLEKVECSTCSGRGYGGSGLSEYDYRMGNWGEKCRRCGGSGQMKSPDPCPRCQGAGVLASTENG